GGVGVAYAGLELASSLAVGGGLEPRDFLCASCELRIGLGQLALGKLVLGHAPPLALNVDLAARIAPPGGLNGCAVCDELRDLLLGGVAFLGSGLRLFLLLGLHAAGCVRGRRAEFGAALLARDDRGGFVGTRARARRVRRRGGRGWRRDRRRGGRGWRR